MTTLSKKIIGVFIVLIILHVSCNKIRIDTSDKFLTKTIVSGYSMHDIPNDIDYPGVIFRVSPDGVRYDVTEIELKTKRGNAQISDYNGSREMDFNFLVKFMGLKNIKDIGVNAEIEKIDSVQVSFKLFDVELEKANDIDIDKGLDSIKDLIIKNMNDNDRQDHEYYIIRESLLAKKMEYNIEKDKRLKQEVSAKFLKLVEADQSLAYNKNDEFPFQFNFESPLRVFYKVERIKMTSGANGEQSLGSKEVSTPIYYKHEKKD